MCVCVCVCDCLCAIAVCTHENEREQCACTCHRTAVKEISVYFLMLLFYNPLFFFFLQDKGAFRKAETARESSCIPAGRFSKKVSRKINRPGLG